MSAPDTAPPVDTSDTPLDLGEPNSFAEVLETLISQNGPFAYHTTKLPERAAMVDVGGILPDQRGGGYGGGAGAAPTRPGTVYLSLSPYEATGTTYRVDLRRLNAKKLVLDEDDAVAYHPDKRPQGRGESLAAYAEKEAAVLDTPRNVSEQIQEKRVIAYKGKIPPDAITRVSQKRVPSTDAALTNRFDVYGGRQGEWVRAVDLKEGDIVLQDGEEYVVAPVELGPNGEQLRYRFAKSIAHGVSLKMDLLGESGSPWFKLLKTAYDVVDRIEQRNQQQQQQQQPPVQ